MGKYMKKAKPKGEKALSDSTNTTTTNNTNNTYCGVRTRAKTLALQKSQSKQEDTPSSSGSYLQLRSRRLEKPPISKPSSSKRAKPQNPKSTIPNNSTSLASENTTHKEKTPPQKPQKNLDAEEASCGENVLDNEVRESRSTRETTPCNMIRNPDVLKTPSSSTRRSRSTGAHRRTEQEARRIIPCTREVDEFFAETEKAQQRKFIEKYNFDPVNDKPLPGRYEWERLTL